MERPIIKITYTSVEKILETITLFIIIFMVIMPICMFSNLPETIPTHINIHGDIDGYGSKGTLLVLPIVGFLSYIGLTVLQRFPHIYNYPVEVTEDNACALYTIGVKMIRFVKTLITVMFTYVTYNFLRLATGNQLKYGSVIPIACCIALIIGMIYYIKKMKKIE